MLANIPMALQKAAAGVAVLEPHQEHRFDDDRYGTTGILLSSRQAEIRPEDITHRGVGLPAACAGGDIPLAAMLLAEGADSGIDMLAADAVS